MKRKSLAFLLALIMILTLVPASAFAATTNTVGKVLTVAADSSVPIVTVNLKLEQDLPGGEWQKVKLSLTNAEWDVSSVVAADLVTAAAIADNSPFGIGIENAGITSAAGIIADRTSATFEFGSSAGVSEGETIKLHLNLEAGSEVGEVKVTIDGLDSYVSDGTYTVAVVGDGNTIATVSGKAKKTGRTDKVTATAIEIREIAVNSVVGMQKLKLTLPKGVSWTDSTTYSGDMVSPAGIINPVAPADISSDGRDLTIEFDTMGAPKREDLVITPVIKVGKDARLGDIEVQVRQQNSGDNKISNASSLIIANYAEEGVTVTTVKEKDLPEIYAGREFKYGTSEYTVEVTLEEIQAGSLITGKYVDFAFEEWVQIATGTGVTAKIGGGSANPISVVADFDDDMSSFEWYVAGLNAGANKITFSIPVTVEANKSGDIELTVSGAKAGVDETKLVVGKAVAPLTAEVKMADIRTGVQNQVGGEILIKETVAGAIRDRNNDKLVVSISDNNQNISFSDANVEVVAGDLEIGKVLITSKGSIEIPVSRNSIKTPAEIKISGVELTLDRTPAEGKYKVGIGGSAVVDNQKYNDGDFAGKVVSTDYVNVVTPATKAANAKFVIGESKYNSNGVEQTMDVAPYIDGANRTMMPIRYVAEALGLTENQIVWDQATQTATIFGEKVVTIKMGSNQIIAGGTPVTMDTVAVNKDSRIYVPARFVANALGANVAWDAATKTVTIYTVVK